MQKIFQKVGTFLIKLKHSPALTDFQAFLIQPVDEEVAWVYPIHGNRVGSTSTGECVLYSQPIPAC